jgi:hypothetical protein
MIEWGIRYDKHPDDVVLGREKNDDGTITRDMVLSCESHARLAVDSHAPIGAIRKRLIRREVTPWEVVSKE